MLPNCCRRNWRGLLASAVLVAGVGLIALAAGPAGLAQPPGKGKGKGMGKDPAFAVDRDVFHFLLDHRKDVRRSVKELPGGVETVTESDAPAVTAKIQEHVAAMHRRVKDQKGIHYRDPLFAEIFRHADKITMKVEKTARGVKVTETSADPYVAKLIKAHAAVVSKFIANGYDEVHKNHPLPEKPAAKDR